KKCDLKPECSRCARNGRACCYIPAPSPHSAPKIRGDATKARLLGKSKTLAVDCVLPVRSPSASFSTTPVLGALSTENNQDQHASHMSPLSLLATPQPFDMASLIGAPDYAVLFNEDYLLNPFVVYDNNWPMEQFLLPPHLCKIPDVRQSTVMDILLDTWEQSFNDIQAVW
ncbi:hypothetical protein HDU82_002817, partial [Entophlyctis luteolus]